MKQQPYLAFIFAAAIASSSLFFEAAASSATTAKTKTRIQSIKQGKILAQKLCARCHAIGKTGKSPKPAAPVFREFATKWPLEQLEEALAEGIVVGHSIMPEFEFETKDITNILNYIGSVTEK